MFASCALVGGSHAPALCLQSTRGFLGPLKCHHLLSKQAPLCFAWCGHLWTFYTRGKLRFSPGPSPHWPVKCPVLSAFLRSCSTTPRPKGHELPGFHYSPTIPPLFCCSNLRFYEVLGSPWRELRRYFSTIRGGRYRYFPVIWESSSCYFSATLAGRGLLF